MTKSQPHPLNTPMTYHAGLIIAILGGLGCGHYVFSMLTLHDLADTSDFYQSIPEQSEPCCGEI
eukprot:Pgem_evm1s4775